MYELLIGVTPFFGKSVRETNQKIKTAEVFWPNQQRCPHTDAFKDLCLQLLQKDPEDRLGHSGGADEILRHEWFRDIDIQALQAQTLEPPSGRPPAFSAEASNKYFNLRQNMADLRLSVVTDEQLAAISQQQGLFA